MWNREMQLHWILIFIMTIIWSGSVTGRGYSYPKPKNPLRYPTPSYLPPTSAPTETPERQEVVTCPPARAPEIERVMFIPEEHLKRDEEMRRTIQEQTLQIEKLGDMVQDQEEKLVNRESVVGRQQEEIVILEEEIRRLRGQPNLGVLLGDKIIEFVEQEKLRVQKESENEEGFEIFRKKTEQRITTTVEDDTDSRNNNNDRDDSRTTSSRSSTSRESSRRFSSSSTGQTSGNDLGSESNDDFRRRIAPLSNSNISRYRNNRDSPNIHSLQYRKYL